MNTAVSQSSGLTGWNTIVRQSVHASRRANSSGNGGWRSGPAAAQSQSLGNLWVENGAIWSLPNFLIGFTEYAGVARFFSSAKSLGYSGSPESLYAGTPFSAHDLPVLLSSPLKHGSNSDHFVPCPFLLWVKASTVQYVNMWFSMLTFPNGRRPASGSHPGPVVPFKTLQNFSANSPSGVRIFKAMYILYIPSLQANSNKVGGSYAGVGNDMHHYSWSS